MPRKEIAKRIPYEFAWWGDESTPETLERLFMDQKPEIEGMAKGRAKATRGDEEEEEEKEEERGTGNGRAGGEGVEKVKETYRAERALLNELPPGRASEVGAFGSPTVESVLAILDVLRELGIERGKGAFHDIGSGTGIVVLSVARVLSPEVSEGVEINESLHRIAVALEKRFKTGAAFRLRDATKTRAAALKTAREGPTVVYAFDLRYPDDLTAKIYEIFSRVKGPAVLLTTKNAQGLGAAFAGITEDLRDATEDAVATRSELFEDPEEVEEAVAAVDGLRDRAMDAFESKKGAAELERELDVAFGGDPFAEEGKEGVVVVKASQDENVTDPITKSYASEATKGERAQEIAEKKGGTVLEKATLRVFVRNFPEKKRTG